MCYSYVLLQHLKVCAKKTYLSDIFRKRDSKMAREDSDLIVVTTADPVHCGW